MKHTVFDGDWKETYPALRLRELKHRKTYPKQNDRMAQAYLRYQNAGKQKENGRIGRELALCQKYWKCYPLHYFRYNQYLADNPLTEAQLKDYIPDFFFYTLFLPYYDGKRYETLIDEKTVSESLFRSLGIPTPHTLAKLLGGRLYAPDGSPATAAQAAEAAAGLGARKIFVKPAKGSGGYGIRVFAQDGSGAYRDKNGESLDGWFQRDETPGGDYILQAGLTQHESLARVYPQAVNTFRIATENKGGEVRLVCAVIRFGGGGREVDNCCQGGIILKVDGASGKTGEFGVAETGERYANHPDTGYPFREFAVEDWEGVKNFALRCAAKLPWFTYLGWDIALTPTGPAVIEANLGFGLDLFQVAHGGLREAFHIADPDFYWKNAGKRTERVCR